MFCSDRFLRPQARLRQRLARAVTAAPLICIALAGAARAEGSPVCARTIRADIVAIEQAYLLNRFSAFVPAGMLFALATDVVALDPDKGPVGPGNAMLRPDKRPRLLRLRLSRRVIGTAMWRGLDAAGVSAGCVTGGAAGR